MKSQSSHYKSLFEDNIAELLESFFDNTAEAITLMDLSGKLLRVNKAFEDMYGWKASEAVGKILPMIPENLFGECNNLTGLVMRGQKIVAHETKRQKKDGSIIDVSITLSPVKDKAGNIVAIAGISRDITAEKNAAQALAESEERYSCLFLNSHVIMLLIDPESGAIVDANNTACKFYGYEKKEIISKKIWEINTLPKEEILQLLKKVLAGEKNNFIFNHRLASGEIRKVETSASVVTLQNKPFFYVIVEDITEKILNEELIRKLSRAVEQSPSTVMITDIYGTIEYVNPKFTELTGYTLDEVIGKTPRFLKSGHTSLQEYKNLWKTITSGKDWRGEFLNKKKNGELFWEYASISPIFDQNNYITHYVAVKEDITERKKAEAKITYMAYHDTLTGLPNRQLFYDRLTLAIAHAKRTKTKLAVMFLDLDGFKAVNDTYGHSVGDALLKGVAQLLRSCLRECDTVARMGGDEFTIILPEIIDEEGASIVAGRILHALQTKRVLNKFKYNITTSIGIAFYPDGGKDAENLLINADTAMYYAKQAGKNKYAFFHTAPIKK